MVTRSHASSRLAPTQLTRLPRGKESAPTYIIALLPVPAINFRATPRFWKRITSGGNFTPNYLLPSIPRPSPSQKSTCLAPSMRKFLVPRPAAADKMPQVRRSSRRSDVKYEEDDSTDELAQETPPSPPPAKEKKPPKKEASQGLSAFERRRLENIAANQVLLNDISATAKKILPPTNGNARSKTSKPVTKKTRDAPVKREAAMPTRRSSRVAGLEPEKDEAKRKYEAVAAGETAEERVKKMRISGDLDLGDTLVEGRKYKSGLDGLAGLKGLSRGAQPGLRTFTDEDVEQTTDKGLKDLRLRMNGLKLYEGWLPNGEFWPPSDHGSQLISV